MDCNSVTDDSIIQVAHSLNDCPREFLSYRVTMEVAIGFIADDKLVSLF
ncbi:hypothetical protein [Macrococcus bovicus]|nr:hypothetical protein [Macrococcus bovicus]